MTIYREDASQKLVKCLSILQFADLDCVLSQHGAVQLDGGQVEVLGDIGVLDSEHFVNALALDPVYVFCVRVYDIRHSRFVEFMEGFVVRGSEMTALVCCLWYDPYHSVATLLDAIADPQPKVLKHESTMFPFSSTLICSFITSPHAGAPTRPVPTLGSFLSKAPTFLGFS